MIAKGKGLRLEYNQFCDIIEYYLCFLIQIDINLQLLFYVEDESDAFELNCHQNYCMSVLPTAVLNQFPDEESGLIEQYDAVHDAYYKGAIRRN